MGDMFTYIKNNGHKTFKEMKFNEIDGLILSQFFYSKIEYLIPKSLNQKQNVTLQHIYNIMEDSIVFSDTRFAKKNRILLDLLLKSERFSMLEFNYSASIVNEDVETQFSAITCFLKDCYPVVVFRGTDDSIVGWKEDFNMAFSKPVPGQILSKLYLNKVGKKLKGMYVIGHSKGGNFAVYSSMNTTEDIKRKIKRIYSYDGPGFRPEVLNSSDFESVEKRIRKFVPKYALVGMLLQSQEEYLVVDSSSIGVLQHDLFSWKIEKNHLKFCDGISERNVKLNESLNTWILQLKEDELEIFVNELYRVFNCTNAKSIIELKSDWKNTIKLIFLALKDTDPKVRKKMIEILKQFIEIVS
ncbi:MAG: Mbeg1-like protein [Lachnospiraceae bacterium]